MSGCSALRPFELAAMARERGSRPIQLGAPGCPAGDVKWLRAAARACSCLWGWGPLNLDFVCRTLQVHANRALHPLPERNTSGNTPCTVQARASLSAHAFSSCRNYARARARADHHAPRNLYVPPTTHGWKRSGMAACRANCGQGPYTPYAACLLYSNAAKATTQHARRRSCYEGIHLS
jgi:hypothetical protein